MPLAVPLPPNGMDAAMSCRPLHFIDAACGTDIFYSRFHFSAPTWFIWHPTSTMSIRISYKGLNRLFFELSIRNDGGSQMRPCDSCCRKKKLKSRAKNAKYISHSVDHKNYCWSLLRPIAAHNPSTSRPPSNTPTLPPIHPPIPEQITHLPTKPTVSISPPSYSRPPTHLQSQFFLKRISSLTYTSYLHLFSSNKTPHPLHQFLHSREKSQ